MCVIWRVQQQMPQRGLERRRERTRVRVRVSNGRQVAIVPLIGPEGDVCVEDVCVLVGGDWLHNVRVRHDSSMLYRLSHDG
jgi:hypothetical protein